MKKRCELCGRVVTNGVTVTFKGKPKINIWGESKHKVYYCPSCIYSRRKVRR